MSGNNFNSGYIGYDRITSTLASNEGIIGGRKHYLKRLSSKYEFVPAGNLITDELLFHLDAGDSNSYPGTGASWFNIAPGRSDFAYLRNEPTYFPLAANSPAKFEFDGSNDYAAFDVGDITSNTVTVELWANITTFSKMIFGFYNYDIWCTGGAMGFNTAASDQYGISSARVQTLGLANSWHHYVFVMHDNISYVNNKIYIDSIDQALYLNQIRGSESTGQRTFNNGLMALSAWQTSTNFTANTNFAQNQSFGEFRFYNKELSSIEISQNYNATYQKYQ
jgi:hypothetical protein